MIALINEAGTFLLCVGSLWSLIFLYVPKYCSKQLVLCSELISYVSPLPPGTANSITTAEAQHLCDGECCVCTLYVHDDVHIE